MNTQKATPEAFDYVAAFSRNRGVISPEEQETLRKSCVAIAGLGGVGGGHAAQLARLGIGRLHIADSDRFELVNFNRQYGATMSSLKRSKCAVTEKIVLDINPQLQVNPFPEGITEENIDQFLEGVDVVIDALDFFALNIRLCLFQKARERGIWVITAGPHAMSASWLLFSPQGMTFEKYFGIEKTMNLLDKTVAFAVGLVPKATHLTYVDLRKYFDANTRAAGSVGMACSLASSVAVTEALKIVLNRGPRLAAPWYFQFDMYRGKFVRGYLWGGAKHPLQRIRRAWLKKMMARS